ncbi:sigma-70 family RNA polymerase sigma factor [Lampropedia puyangensis]|uniref:Sigma-70 family RNA polymerase sigma factor n=2 Tax=Lampropedia puyangensis TaxID=1330072 RepID=A0A4S8FBX9_9BURK|nr:sigma-70 family RNA polymerase sigma factor [Lampropedia puyangensis]
MKAVTPPTLAADPLTSLYLDHQAWLLDWLRRKTRNVHHAQDLTQDTFCRLLSISPQELRNLRQPRALLVTTASRLLIDHSRRKALETAYLAELEALSSHAHAPSTEARVQTLELLGLLARMLDGLPDKPRRAFLLCRFDGMDYAQIAEELDVSKSMVKQYIAKVMVHCYTLVHGTAN